MTQIFKNVLVLAPHTDDGELGAGGFIAKLVEDGAKVTYVAFSAAEESVPSHLPRDILRHEVKSATLCLGIKPEDLIVLNYPVRKLNYYRQEILEDLIKIRNSSEYDLVLIPSLKDIHQDHAAVANEGVRAFKNTTILGYELVWNNITSDSTCLINIQEKHLEKKYLALQCYKSQEHRKYMGQEFIFSLARVRGAQIGKDFAESYEVIRWVIS
tara:strand:- start:5861 stop:6499 length:639 start_codon:yes stop_codon:yes gene_type:complete